MNTDESQSMQAPPDNIASLHRKIKNLERDLKLARHQIHKLKTQKNKLLKKIKSPKMTTLRTKPPRFFSE